MNYKQLILGVILLFSFQFDATSQQKCVEILRAKAIDHIITEESVGRNHGECSPAYQMFEENKCHAWTDALWDPMIDDARSCANEHKEIVCVHNMTVLFPGTHNYIGITVSKKNTKSRGFAVDGWRCERVNQNRMSREYPKFYEMHSIYDSNDPQKRFTYNINQFGGPRGKPVGHMISKGAPPLWAPAWIEPHGLSIGQIECFGGSPTKTPTASPSDPVRTPTKTRTPTNSDKECGPSIGSCEYPSCCNSSGFCKTDVHSCNDDCNPEFGYCVTTPTPTAFPTATSPSYPTFTPSPTATPEPTITPTPLDADSQKIKMKAT